MRLNRPKPLVESNRGEETEPTLRYTHLGTMASTNTDPQRSAYASSSASSHGHMPALAVVAASSAASQSSCGAECYGDCECCLPPPDLSYLFNQDLTGTQKKDALAAQGMLENAQYHFRGRFEMENGGTRSEEAQRDLDSTLRTLAPKALQEGLGQGASRVLTGKPRSKTIEDSRPLLEDTHGRLLCSQKLGEKVDREGGGRTR